MLTGQSLRKPGQFPIACLELSYTGDSLQNKYSHVESDLSISVLGMLLGLFLMFISTDLTADYLLALGCHCLAKIVLGALGIVTRMPSVL